LSQRDVNSSPESFRGNVLPTRSENAFNLLCHVEQRRNISRCFRAD
jgi:hypothetical protein